MNEAKPEDKKAKVYSFDTREKFDEFAMEEERSNCFGLFFNKVDKANFDYEVVTSLNKFTTIDTNKPLVRPLITKPDMTSW